MDILLSSVDSILVFIMTFWANTSLTQKSRSYCVWQLGKQNILEKSDKSFVYIQARSQDRFWGCAGPPKSGPFWPKSGLFEPHSLNPIQHSIFGPLCGKKWTFQQILGGASDSPPQSYGPVYIQKVHFLPHQHWELWGFVCNIKSPFSTEIHF